MGFFNRNRNIPEILHIGTRASSDSSHTDHKEHPTSKAQDTARIAFIKGGSDAAYARSAWIAKRKHADDEQIRQLAQDNDELKDQIKALTTQTSFRRRVALTLASLIITSAAVGVLIATFVFPVLRVVGTSMYPTLTTDDIIVINKTGAIDRGDIVACYLNNRIILKRAIAFQGEMVVIDADGNVSVDGKLLNEPYVSNLSLEHNDLAYPYQVPEGQIFVLGDHRSTSEDSRVLSVGCMPNDKVLGKAFFRLWPIVATGPLSGADYEQASSEDHEDTIDTQDSKSGKTQDSKSPSQDTSSDTSLYDSAALGDEE